MQTAERATLNPIHIALYKQSVRQSLMDGALGVDIWTGEILLKPKEKWEYNNIEQVLALLRPDHDGSGTNGVMGKESA